MYQRMRLKGTYWSGPRHTLLGSRHFLLDPYLEFPYLPLLFQHPILVIPLLLHLNCQPLLGFLGLQWVGHACMWSWEVWVGRCLMCWRERSPCLAWESSTNSSGRFPCLNSMPWTYIRLGYSHWDQDILPPCFWKLGYCVGSPPRAPESTVLAVYGGDFRSLRSRLTRSSWG